MSSLAQRVLTPSFLFRTADRRVQSAKYTIASTVVCDFIAVALAAAVSLAATHVLHKPVALEAYWKMVPLLFAAVLGNAAFGLYSVGLFNPVEELKRIAVSSTILYLGIGTCTFLYQEPRRYSRAVLLLAWALTLIAVPNLRRALRRMAHGLRWWGCPVAVIGSAGFVERMGTLLARAGELSLVPVLSVCNTGSEPAAFDIEDLCEKVRRADPYYVLFEQPDVDSHTLRSIVVSIAASARRVLVFPIFNPVDGLQVTARQCGGTLALEINNGLRVPEKLVLKRAIDFMLALTACLVLLPVFLLIAAAVKFTSRGPVFYGHWRYGKHGRRFRAIKFRSMVQNGDAVLRKYLAENEPMREGWERNHKLQKDPRVTSIGRLLRVTSLDELPQLWNVLRNEMSLVGPRPVVEEEILRYGNVFESYKQVPPGITGLWQVSGRSNTTYDERIRFDEYYVRNWSVWLDLHILLRTIIVVVSREGAC
jgi:Undecaprenyl-phosphate galactose phosphotransferase WbaP